MDLLYSRYASPYNFMKLYIDQGRFGEFVYEIVELDIKWKKEELEKINENRLWDAYIHSMSDKTFIEWKRELQTKKEPVSYSMTSKEITEVKQHTAGILKRISPV